MQPILGTWHPLTKYLRDEMRKNSYSWTEVSKATSISSGTIQDIFAGKHSPSFENVERVANALGFHLVLKPMNGQELEQLDIGKYIHPVIAS